MCEASHEPPSLSPSPNSNSKRRSSPSGSRLPQVRKRTASPGATAPELGIITHTSSGGRFSIGGSVVVVVVVVGGVVVVVATVVVVSVVFVAEPAPPPLL